MRTNISTIRIELLGFAFIIVILNLPLINGRYSHSMIFLLSAITCGEYWRIFTHPFIHVSIYHLLLDAGAFLLLYGSLKEPSRLKRMGYVIVCGTGSLLLSILTSPKVLVMGFCGLSGIAHGIMAVSALEGIERKKNTIWYIMFLVVVSKSIIELINSRVLFDSLHLGMMGFPIAASHAGGVLGGIIFYVILRHFTRITKGK